MRIWMPTRITLAHGVGGGMERHADALARGLADGGHEVTVVTTAHPGGRLREGEGLLEEVYVPGTTWRRYQRRWWAASYELLSARHRARPYDAVVSHSAGALGYVTRAHRQLGLPSVVVLHGSARSERARAWRSAANPRGLYRLARLGWRLPALHARWRGAAPDVAHWIAVSEAPAADTRRALGLAPERVSVVPPPVDLAAFRPGAPAGRATRRRLGIPPAAPVVCFASRLERTKGAHVLVEAVARVRPTHPDLRLLVAGAGPAEPGLRRQVSGLGLGDRVLLLGRVDHADLPAVHAAADLFALPALAPEGLPLSLAEAMASGLPVVASSVGGVAEAVEDGVTGVLTPPGDAAALAAAVAGLLADGEGRVAMGARARQAAAARFDAVAVVDAVEGVVAGAVGVAR